ncbi:heavy metal-binding domain-containing protein [bacterium]|nr:heavy metal-binding domain-containing protein [bacterium]
MPLLANASELAEHALILLPIALLILAWITGSTTEKRHFRRLAARERALKSMLVTDIKTFPGGAIPQQQAALVTGGAVIASDYLKSFFAHIRKIFGGELRSYLSLMERARREAILRMLEQAHRLGYNAVCNVRLNSADIGGMTGKKGAAMVECFASGTAYSRPPGAADAQAVS